MMYGGSRVGRYHGYPIRGADPLFGVVSTAWAQQPCREIDFEIAEWLGIPFGDPAEATTFSALQITAGAEPEASPQIFREFT
jgi:hypothetical protein